MKSPTWLDVIGAFAVLAIIFGIWLITQDTDIVEFWQTHVVTYEIN